MTLVFRLDEETGCPQEISGTSQNKLCFSRDQRKHCGLVGSRSWQAAEKKDEPRGVASQKRRNPWTLRLESFPQALTRIVRYSLLGANKPCRKLSFTPFWGVQRGVTPMERGCMGVSPLTFPSVRRHAIVVNGAARHCSQWRRISLFP